MDIKERLKKELSHGDAQHQEWLSSAIDAVFDGQPTPEPYGQGAKEQLQHRLSAAKGCILAFKEYFGAIARGEYANNGREARIRAYEQILLHLAESILNDEEV